jgi:phage-related protein
MANPGAGAELTELVTQMQATINEHFFPTLSELEKKVEAETSRVQDWLHDIADAIKAAQPVATAGFAHCRDEIGKAEQAVKAELDHCVQTINGFVGHLHDHKGKAQELLGTALAGVADSVDKLHLAGESHAATHEQLAQKLSELSSHTDDSLATLATHHEQIIGSVATLGDQATQHFADVGAKLAQAGEFVTEHVSQTVQGHVANVGELVNAQKDHLLHAVSDVLGGDIGGFIGDIEGFMQAGEQLGQVFDGGLGDVLGKVDEVTGLIEQIKPVLDVAKELC